MKIAINPTPVFIPGQGIVTASQIEVRVQNLDLGNAVTCGYDVQSLDVTDPKNVKTKTLASGTGRLTPEQFAKWGADDSYCARCIAENTGLTPIE